MKIAKLVPVIFITAVLLGCSTEVDTNSGTITNGTVWTDMSGNSIQAHDNIIKYGSKYYWYGMDYSKNLRTGDNNGFRAVKCYESADLVNWKFKNNVLTAVSSDLLYYSDINAPTVLYNPNTDKFVMWMGYNTQKTLNYSLVATCDSPYGDFEVQNSTFKINEGSEMTTLFKDSDYKAYALSYCAYNKNGDCAFFIYKLTDDYLSVDTSEYNGILAEMFPRFMIGRASIIKYGNYYYYFASTNYGLCYAYSKSLSGYWSGLEKFGPDNYPAQEFGSVITIQGASETSYLLAFNKWNVSDLSNSGYVWQPLIFDNSKVVPKPMFNNYVTLTIDAAAGTVTGN